ncbi:MAG: Gfo/Idh/MocA family oxidoreductase [Deltaproteobacteria bacterium]
MLNVAIIGAGLIGRKRAESIKAFGSCRISAVADIDSQRAESLAKEFGAWHAPSWKDAVAGKEIDACVVATFNASLAGIAIAALQNKKHVLCEKPLGVTSNESLQMIEAAEQNRRILKTGFNHRHHPAMILAKRLLDEGGIGGLCFLRCRYGHGGRPGYENEWRADRKKSGGGELLDQGVHVLDLLRWFAGEFTRVYGVAEKYFWDSRVEDNAFATLKTNTGVVATMHTSWTQWKNIFSFEAFGKDGFLIIDGLGGSYGKETLRLGIRGKKGGAPREKVFEFNEPDCSWKEEWKEFLSAIDFSSESPRPSRAVHGAVGLKDKGLGFVRTDQGVRPMLGSGYDGFKANCLVEAIYESSLSGTVVSPLPFALDRELI